MDLHYICQTQPKYPRIARRLQSWWLGWEDRWCTGQLTNLSNFSSLPSLAASSRWTPPLPLWNAPAVLASIIRFKWANIQRPGKALSKYVSPSQSDPSRATLFLKGRISFIRPHCIDFHLFPNINLSSVLDRSGCYTVHSVMQREWKSGSWLFKLSEHLGIRSTAV